MPHRFVIADVFTENAFGGNQLAVLPDGRGISERAMQTLAREFNFSETTFVLPPETPGTDYRLRIFTARQACRQWAIRVGIVNGRSVTAGFVASSRMRGS